MTAKLLVLSGYGLNCEMETLAAFEHVGITGDIVHINDLIDAPEKLKEYQVLAFPGGFSYGDDTGSGNAYAQKLQHHVRDELLSFVERDTLTIGICNGCQILAKLGFVGGGDEHGVQDVTLEHNASNRYQCRWVDLRVNDESNSVWVQGIRNLHVPVAHGEGHFTMSPEVFTAVQQKNRNALTYARPDGSSAAGEFPYNPNGAMGDIAALTDKTGRIFAMMPHPERGMFFWQREDYPLLKEQYLRVGKELPVEADGMKLFHNAAQYFG
ncbi:MAG: phosphoribosylformylglycinamidine synthase subunit PurQ [Alphaproteobacteria bacterium]